MIELGSLIIGHHPLPHDRWWYLINQSQVGAIIVMYDKAKRVMSGYDLQIIVELINRKQCSQGKNRRATNKGTTQSIHTRDHIMMFLSMIDQIYTVVPQDYDRVEKFLSLSDIIAVLRSRSVYYCFVLVLVYEQQACLRALTWALELCTDIYPFKLINRCCNWTDSCGSYYIAQCPLAITIRNL